MQSLLGRLALRRLKTQMRNGRPVVDLPKRVVIVERVELSDEERCLYNAVQTQGKLTVGKLVPVADYI